MVCVPNKLCIATVGRTEVSENAYLANDAMVNAGGAYEAGV